MKKFAMTMLFVFIYLSMSIASVYASVSIKASITGDIYVVFEFTNINSEVYDNIKNQGLITADTIPYTIAETMASKNRFGVDYFSTSRDFDDVARSIRCAFHLRGPNILNSTVYRESLIESFVINTDWRKFYLNITSGLVYNFTRSLATQLVYWKNSTVEGVTSFSYSNIDEGVSCSFELPKNAANVYVVGDTLFFDAPFEPPWEDKLINSPILILIGLAVAGVIVLVYRKIR